MHTMRDGQKRVSGRGESFRVEDTTKIEAQGYPEFLVIRKSTLLFQRNFMDSYLST